jgi:hypothetical protein
MLLQTGGRWRGPSLPTQVLNRDVASQQNLGIGESIENVSSHQSQTGGVPISLTGRIPCQLGAYDTWCDWFSVISDDGRMNLCARKEYSNCLEQENYERNRYAETVFGHRKQLLNSFWKPIRSLELYILEWKGKKMA